MRGKHIASWTAIGIGVGAALGSATGEMGVWVAVGAAVGRKAPTRPSEIRHNGIRGQDTQSVRRNMNSW
jgi:hypothetical protein